MDAQKDILRTRDFWASLVLIALSIFFLWRTSFIPLFGANRAGVSGADWYNSAAIVPLGIFTAILVLSIFMLITAIRAGGAKRALSTVGIGWNKDEAFRFITLSIIMISYVVGLVPRVDFWIASALTITAMIFGYWGGIRTRATIATLFVLTPGLFAYIFFFSQANWKHHADDWVALAAFVGLTAIVLSKVKSERLLRVIPMIALIAPLILALAMAFGFRQNVPARGGLLFQQIEYHYYVTIRPIWQN